MVDYEVLTPITDPVAARPGSPLVHAPRRRATSCGNVRARARGDSAADGADVVVTGEYQVGMQDQAFLGPESGLAVPAEDGGVDLYIATQWLHVDQRQVAAALGLARGARSASRWPASAAPSARREDLSMQVHACLLALRTGRPIKMVYSREESFFGHVHRHPALLRYEHGADSRRPAGLRPGARSCSTAAPTPRPRRRSSATRRRSAVGPYEVPNVTMDCYGAYTNNPPCGAMRGFGAVQACFAYESQMDKLAEACGLSTRSSCGSATR